MKRSNLLPVLVNPVIDMKSPVVVQTVLCLKLSATAVHLELYDLIVYKRIMHKLEILISKKTVENFVIHFRQFCMQNLQVNEDKKCHQTLSSIKFLMVSFFIKVSRRFYRGKGIRYHKKIHGLVLA